MLPHKSLTDQKEFYRILSEIISTHRADLGGIEASDVEIKTENNPAIKGLSMMFNVSGSAAINISQNMINGYYVPDGIILLMSR
jgi:fumarylacetoacetate (FAA) hydrolase family protein